MHFFRALHAIYYSNIPSDTSSATSRTSTKHARHPLSAVSVFKPRKTSYMRKYYSRIYSGAYLLFFASSCMCRVWMAGVWYNVCRSPPPVTCPRAAESRGKSLYVSACEACESVSRESASGYVTGPGVGPVIHARACLLPAEKVRQFCSLRIFISLLGTYLVCSYATTSARVSPCTHATSRHQPRA